MNTIYVVMGSTGEYSDKDYWPVKAFLNKELSEKYIAKCSARAREIENTRPSRYDLEKGLNKFDPEMRMDYTGTSYFYYQVELVS
jgi:hypothetical protein